MSSLTLQRKLHQGDSATFLAHQADSGEVGFQLVARVLVLACTRPIQLSGSETQSSQRYATGAVFFPAGLGILTEWAGAGPRILRRHHHAQQQGETQTPLCGFPL